MIGFVLWALLFAAMVVLEGVSLTVRGHAWPSLSDLLRAATRPPIGRWLMLALWLWLGWHLFIRGWTFFLRGSGARVPGNGHGGRKRFGEIVEQVLLPLVVLYGALLAMLVAGWHARLRPVPAELRGVAVAVRRNPRLFAKYTAVTLVASYLIFVTVMASYELIVGRSASGLARDALTGGAFMAFGVELPVFVIATIVWSVVVTGRRRGARDAPAESGQ